jgi:DNA-binding transcriptional MerR regulator
MTGEQIGDDVLDEAQAAELLGVSTYTLTMERKRGDGPPFRRVGKEIRYSRVAVLAWLAQGEGTTA